MTNRYDLYIASMIEAARTVTIIFTLALGILAARWSIKFIPEKMRPASQALFDLWLIVCNLILFVVSS